jgi:hypothetical protein
VLIGFLARARLHGRPACLAPCAAENRSANGSSTEALRAVTPRVAPGALVVPFATCCLNSSANSRTASCLRYDVDRREAIARRSSGLISDGRDEPAGGRLPKSWPHQTSVWPWPNYRTLQKPRGGQGQARQGEASGCNLNTAGTSTRRGSSIRRKRAGGQMSLLDANPLEEIRSFVSKIRFLRMCCGCPELGRQSDGSSESAISLRSHRTSAVDRRDFSGWDDELSGPSQIVGGQF